MPNMDGLETLRTLRRTRSSSDLPIITVTLKSGHDDALAVLKSGANDYVTKPIDFAELFTRIEAQLARRQAELAMRKSQQDLERRYRELYDDTPSMFFTLNAAGTVLSVNRFGAERLGYNIAELVGAPVYSLFDEQHRAATQEWVGACFDKPDVVHRWEACKRHKNGQAMWVRESARVMTDDAGRATLLIVCEDVSEVHYLSQQLSHQATHDDLTGLLNRREFGRRLQRILKSAREEHTEHALCYLDLDQFKVINDTCGHMAGDELLRQLSDELQKKIRQRDTLARLGGDEFGVLMEHCSLAQARRVANELRECVEGFKFLWRDIGYGIGASIGLVPITSASEDIASVLSAADRACYVAKDAGRNRVHEFHERDTVMVRRHDELQRVMQIDRALEKDQLLLYYQPILPLSNPEHVGEHYELLVRMRGADGRITAPGSFLPTAERFNLIPRLDRWVLSTALNWLTRHPEHLERLFLCGINLSGQSLADDDFCRTVLQELEKTGVPPNKLCFEITETAAIVNMSKAIRFIKALKERGCLFSLDDFGSGLSSFAYLKNLPVDFLKIDGQFVKDIADDATDLEMVKSISGIGRVMGKKTIAEFGHTRQTARDRRRLRPRLRDR
jgi:diguanylate cyclase (GGDEF)-like protein/PAS domain S-box-containing protein